MTLKGPNPEDIRKIHSEINQIVNQRFSLTVLSMTVFGVFLALLTPKEHPTNINEFSQLVYIGSTILLIILFIIFYVTHQLCKMLRVFSTYLSTTGTSNWEDDWALFRVKFRYIGYTKPQALIFILLGILTTLFPTLLLLAYFSTIILNWEFILCLTGGVIYTVFVLGMGFKKWFDSEDDYLARWTILKI